MDSATLLGNKWEFQVGAVYICYYCGRNVNIRELLIPAMILQYTVIFEAEYVVLWWTGNIIMLYTVVMLPVDWIEVQKVPAFRLNVCL